MKKIFYILFFIITYTTVNAQYKYRVEYDIDFPKYDIDKTSYKMVLANGVGTTSNEQIFFHFVTNVPLQSGESNSINKKASFIIETSVPYSGMKFTARKVNSGSTFTSYHDFGCYQNDIDLIVYGIVNVNYLRVFSALLSEANSYSSTNNNLLDCDSKTIQISTITTCGNINYGVQYQIGSNTSTWTTLLPYTNRLTSFDIQRSDFAGLSTHQPLRLRIFYDETVPDYSDIITYNYIECSPGVISHAIQNTSCSNTSNGKFTLNFNRTLNVNETLAMSLYRDSPTVGPLIGSLTGVIYTGTSYLWSNNLPAGTYYLKYQTEPTSNVVTVGPIVITAPSPVLFTATWVDVNCFRTNTGSISINASGGVGNYQYSINNGVDWFAFSNATTHTITNLPVGTYQVKVRDMNNCISQQ